MLLNDGRKISIEGLIFIEARSVVEKRAWVMEYYADNGYLLSRDDVVNTDGRKVS